MALPTVTTQAATNITITSVDGNGEIGGQFNIGYAEFNQSAPLQASSPEAVIFNNDGTKMYELEFEFEASLIHTYNLSTAWDISTATFSSTDSLAIQDDAPTSIIFNNDGTKLYETGTFSDLIYESDLSTSYDISTATFSQSVAAQASSIESLAFKSDGTKLYEVDFSSDLIYEHDLSTAWDLSTRTLNQSIATQNDFTNGIAISNDGTRLHEVGFGGTGLLIYESILSTPWDISTASFNQTISSQKEDPRFITWNNDGTKFYESHSNEAFVYQSDLVFDLTERGFVYSTTSRTDPGNTSPAASDYESVENETGTFGTGTYSLTLSGLTVDTTYYVRAYAENSEGYSYGDEVSFTTLEQKPQLNGITQITGATQINF